MPAPRRLDFPGPSGARLAARLEMPDEPPRGAALLAHCFTCGKDIAGARRIAAGLAARGFAVLRFDFTGLGHSEGEFASTGFTSNVEDLAAAAEAMAAQGLPPTLLLGHSLGGAAAIAAAGRIPSVKAVAVIGAPSDPAHVLERLGASVETIRERGEAEVTLGGRSFTLGRSFVEEVEAARLEPALADLKRPLLILHAPRDEVVGIDHASAIFKAARHPKSFVSLDDADHLLTRPEDAAYAAEVIAAWAARYAAEAPGAAPPPEGPAPEGVVRAAEADPEGFLQHVSSGPHALLADEPESMGGANRGLSPYGLLSAALAACTSMTIRMYARRKGWPLEAVSVDVSHAKVHAEDCEDCERKGAKVDRFARKLHLRGDLSEDQRARLAEIADRCPVHRTLHSEVEVTTALD